MTYDHSNQADNRLGSYERLKQLHRVTTTPYADLGPMLEDYLHTGCELFGLPTGIISRIEGQTYTVLEIESPLDILTRGLEFQLAETYCAAVIRERKTIAYNMVSVLESLREHPVDAHLKREAYISAPIWVEGEIYGTLNFSDVEPRYEPFTQQDYEMLEMMANGIGRFIAIHEKEQALKESLALEQENRNKLRAVVETAVDGIITIDDTGTIETANASAERVFGYDTGELIGHNVKILMPEPYHGEHDGYLQDYLTTGQAKIIGSGRELVACRKDGSIFDIFLSVSEMRLQERRMFTGIVRDITRRKQAVRDLDRIFNMSLDMICIAGTDGYFKQMNPAFERVLGYTREEMLAQPFLSFVHEADQQSTIDVVSKLAEGEPLVYFENRYRAKDGRYLWLGWTSVSVPEDESLYAIARDVTDQKAWQAQQAALMQEVERVNKELKDFAYIVSHDLKAPLRAIGSLSEWITTDYAAQLDEDGREMVKLLNTRVKRMDDLINGILQYSRAGRSDDDKTEIKLNGLIAGVVDLLGEQEAIEITVAPDMPEIIGEKIPIEQLFQNLLSNAIKYMDKPEGKIQVDYTGDGDFWRFSIADNGPGIEERYFDKIFQIFQTLASRDEVEGTGVGLALVKKIVERHGGKVWLTSQIGQGSRFYFTLPKMDAAQDADTP